MKDLHDYRNIQEEKRNGKTKLDTSIELQMSRDTVTKYWDVDEDTFKEIFYRKKKIDSLERRTKDIMTCIKRNRNVSARKIHEYLMQAGVSCSERTTARFVRQMRDKYGLRK